VNIIAKEPPTEKVKEMKDEEISDEEIIKALSPKFSNKEINDAVNQASEEIPEDNPLEEMDNLTQDSEEPEELLEEAPTPDSEEQGTQEQYPSYNQTSLSSDQTQQVIEAVVEEKWDDLISKMGDLNLWKENVNNDLESLKQELLRTQERLNALQNIMVGKINEYSRGINDVSIEMKALEQVFQKILQPLTSNIKDLNKVTSELKAHKSKLKKKK